MIRTQKAKKAVLLSTILLVFFLSYAVGVSAISFKELLGIGTDEAEEVDKKKNKPTEKSSTAKGNKKDKAQKAKQSDDNKAKLSFSDIENTLSVLDANQRKQILADEKRFYELVIQEANNSSVLFAAKVNNIHSNEKTRVLAQRAVDNLIREVYLNQLLISKIPQGFPNEEQSKEYYEKNKETFEVSERVHAWQIFFPLTKEMKTKDIELVKKKAEKVVADLKKKKIDFETAVNQYSKHELSRLNGGYMGLIKVIDMKPEIKETIKKLKVGEISKPVKTDDGVHVLKRGAVVPKQEITYSQAKPKIREIMLQQLQQQIRQAVYKQAKETYPVDINDKKVEEWRLKLRTQ